MKWNRAQREGGQAEQKKNKRLDNCIIFGRHCTLGGKRVFSGHKIARKPTNEGPIFSRLYGKSNGVKTDENWPIRSVIGGRSQFLYSFHCARTAGILVPLAGFLSVFGQLKSLLPPCV